MSAPLKLGDDGVFIIAAELDFEDELNIAVDYSDCQVDRYLTIEELKTLREHLNHLLEGRA